MTTPEPYYNNDPKSFAWKSARERWPVILTNAIDDVHQAVAKLDAGTEGEKLAEGKKIISQLIALKHDLEHDRKLEPLEGDAKDLKDYNEALAKLPAEHNTWATAAWLYSECYLYRKIGTFFDATQHWKNYDLFLTQKDDTFRNSQAAVSELASRYHQLASQLNKDTNDKALEVLFREFVDISLWGNATDLSLLTNISLEDIQALQGAESRQKNQKNVLANDMEYACDAVISEKGGRIDLILDNAGFELYTDLILALFLLDAKLADTIVLHPKNYPWFVSDVLPADFLHTINHLQDPDFFGEGVNRDELSYLVEKLVNYHGDGKLVIRTSPFWTTHYGFSEISQDSKATGAAAVWDDLKDSKLVILKGDLNHRKLLWDLAWPRTTPFLTAIGPLADSGVRILTLRTTKADTVSGLPEGKEEELEKEWVAAGHKDEPHGWAWSGKYALVQYSEGARE